MKLVDLQYIQSGVRKLAAVKETLEHMQDAYKEAIAFLTDGIIAQASGVTVLYGCVNSGSGADYVISAGAVYYNGELYEVPAFSGTATGADVPVLSLNTSYLASDPALYQKADGTSENINTHSIRKLLWSFAASGSGIADFSAIVTIKARLAALLASEFGGDFAPLDSPAFTGVPTAPTPATATNTTQIATAAFVHAVVAALVDSAPGTLDTLNELAAALGDDPNFATTLTNLVADKVTKTGDTMTGALIGTTAEMVDGIRTAASGPYLKRKVVEIGDWDMDATNTVNVNHGLTLAKIRGIKAIIRNDADTVYYDLNSWVTSSDVPEGYFTSIQTTFIVLTRKLTGFFDGVDFNSTGYNRGWILIDYES